MKESFNKNDYGFWNSPFQAKDLASKSISFTDLFIDNGVVYWGESRPDEKGRNVIVSMHPDGSIQDETPPEFSVGTMVHGYGGGAFLVKENQLYFANSKDGMVYHKNLNTKEINPVTFPFEGRFADFSLDSKRKFLYCLRKNDSTQNQFPPTEIVRINLVTKETEVLFTGSDFYSNPSVSPDGKKLCWLQWNHPNMPWDNNELFVADISSENIITNSKKILNSSVGACYQPIWSPKNELFVTFDGNNYWNIYKIVNDSFEIILEKKSDFGRPMWISGTRTFSFLQEDILIVTFCDNGMWKTGKIYLKNNGFVEINNNLSTIYNIAADNNQFVMFAGNSLLALAVVSSNIKEPFKFKILRKSLDDSFPSNYISEPKEIEFTARDNKSVYAFYYPPFNPEYLKDENNLPPLIVKIHGGPTANVDCLMNPKIQYYTSRGFAYLEVNYRGSTGFGRSYREELKGKWGIKDVEDCLDAVKYLIQKNLVNKDKVILAGSSSGGYTLLSTLVKNNKFLCASCTYGIADLIAMTEHIHKFEAYYDQSLIGGSILTDKELYFNRSPINSANEIKTPIIFFHGDKDPVVNVKQTEKIATALKENNIYHEVYIFSGEGHGFKKAESIVKVLDKELKFFQKYLSN
ncbi:prolyl oligopeptidase family serine peptidase [Pigmentibacter sp. JX0631]|uniref:S9 family peptidase n=1 Tax=Pigmentibacter sp. JX0631 TaxID=2976982 RepID=UPI0024694116|nr:prolyl oligopeptidase family serine peptidase [Pigmentibacter sp. JX0631]WGL60868.1 prolyl oligopeptidase family serine peptidase [Pigmentibacter sp. JX0631]